MVIFGGARQAGGHVRQLARAAVPFAIWTRALAIWTAEIANWTGQIAS